jgi:YVTN family beta-propeller protein
MKKIVLLLGISMLAFATLSCQQETKKNTKQKEEGTIIVANKSGNDVYFIERSTGKTIKKLPTGYAPHEVEVSGDGKTAVVCNYGDREKPGNTLSVYNVEKGKLIRTIDLKEHTHPHGMDWIDGTSKMLVTTEGTESLLLVNVNKGEILKSMETNQEISHMVVAGTNKKSAYVSSIRTGNVTVLDLKTGNIVKQIYSGEGAEGLDVSPDGKELWVTNRAENTLSIFDTENLKLITRIESGKFPIRAKFSPNGKYFVVSNAESGHIAVFDAEHKKLIKKIKLTPPVPEGRDKDRYFAEFEGSSVPIGVVVPDNKTAYVANTHSDVVTVFNLEELKIEKHIEAGKEPDGINYSPLTPGN